MQEDYRITRLLDLPGRIVIWSKDEFAIIFSMIIANAFYFKKPLLYLFVPIVYYSWIRLKKLFDLRGVNYKQVLYWHLGIAPVAFSKNYIKLPESSKRKFLG